MSTVPVHVWKPDASGFPTYLCGIDAEQVVASVAEGRINLFPAELLCDDCLRIHQIEAAFYQLELRPIIRKAAAH